MVNDSDKALHLTGISPALHAGRRALTLDLKGIYCS
jgi:hypothetical protein